MAKRCLTKKPTRWTRCCTHLHVSGRVYVVLKRKAVDSSKSCVYIYQITRRHIQEDRSIQFHDCKIVLLFSHPLYSPFLFSRVAFSLLFAPVIDWQFSQHPASIGLTHCLLTMHFYPEVGGNIVLRNAGVQLYD
jgi:hypothetical protein